MRLGFIGPCRGDLASLRAAAELLLFELDADRAIYLGADDALDRSIKGWPERLGAPADEGAFLTELALLAPEAPAEVLETLLSADRKVRRLADVATLPPPPSRAVEMFEDRVVLMVYDKAVLDEDDVANATVIVWGNAAEPVLRPIGPRLFLSPGLLNSAAGPAVALVDARAESVGCSLRDLKGAVRVEHTLSLTRGTRMGVQ